MSPMDLMDFLRHFFSLAISLASPFCFGSILGGLTTLSHWDGPFT